MRSFSVAPWLAPRARSYSATFVNAMGKRVSRSLLTRDLGQAELLCAGLVILRRAQVKSEIECSGLDVPQLAIDLYFGATEIKPEALEVDPTNEEEYAAIDALARTLERFPAELQPEVAAALRKLQVLRKKVAEARNTSARLEKELAEEKTRREAIERSVVARAAAAAAKAPTIAAAQAEFKSHIESATARRNARDHVNGLQRFIESLPAGLDNVAQIQASHVSAFLDARATEGDESRRQSRRRAWRILLARFFSYLKIAYHLPSPLEHLPAVKKGAVLRERGDIDWHKLEEVQAAIAAAPDPYWKALIGSLGFAGLQLAELIWLRRSDLELAGDRAKFWITTVEDESGRRHELKTENRRRHVDIHPTHLLPLLRAFLESGLAGETFLFKMRSQVTVKGKLRERARRSETAETERWLESTLSARLRGHAGGKDQKKRPPTIGILPEGMTALSLRRTFGSLLLRSGKSAAEVAAAMGNTEQVVRDHYARILGCEVDVDF